MPTEPGHLKPSPAPPARTADALPAPGLDHAALAHAVERWFAHAARPLPWRTASPAAAGTARDPWTCLVAELMLQQTQVSRVLEKLAPFLARFPTPASLAAAEEAEVLALWSGLGYYRRARLLQAAARAIVERHGGSVPHDPASLRALPGLGPYTAGSIASIVFGRREPIVDGNILRVLLRLHARPLSAADPEAVALAWSEARALVDAAGDPAALNEGLMELGATICTPAAPRCVVCPVHAHCSAAAEGSQDTIPRPKPRAARQPLFAAVALCVDGRGRALVEQRAERGLWAALWQAPTLERPDRPPTPAELAEHLGSAVGQEMEAFDFATTHRAVRFGLHRAERPPGRASKGRRWVTASDLPALGLSSPQTRILRQALGL